MKSRPGQPPFAAVIRRLWLIVLCANFVGAGLTFLILVVALPVPTGEGPLQHLEPEYVALFLSVVVAGVLVGTTWIRRATTQIRIWYEHLRAGGAAAEVPPDVLRAVLELSPRLVLVGAIPWLVAGFVFAPYRVLLIGGTLTDLRQGFIAIVGAGGLATIACVFFATDLVWREVTALFFTEGRVSVVRAFRLPVLVRLLIVFLLVGLWPATILVALAIQRAHVLVASPNPQAVLANMILLELFLLVGSGVLGVGMAAFMTRSVVGPLRALAAGMRRVEQNDLDVRVPVTSNDELGQVTERFNEMVAGLRQREALRSLLDLYLSPEVAREAIEHGAELGGKLIECTALFSDIRNYTGLSDRLPPDELITLLNRYMTAMVGAIVEHRGMVITFGGDSILAVFGTPLNPAADHAACAVRAALSMRQALAAFNRGQSDDLVLRIGIGIATGPAIAGNVGGRERIEYTVTGVTVNLASRLQDKTKELGLDLLLSAATYEAACASVPLAAQSLPPVEVRGKSEPVAVYTLPAADIAAAVAD